MSSQLANAVEALDSMLTEINAAAEKTAEANTEPGGYQGASTHPSTDADDRTDDAREGSRSSENEQDVKEDQGSPSVENTTPGTPGGQDSVTLNIGTTSKATGEDSSVETSSAKGGKDDPGTQRGSTEHPARTDNDALDGHKYADMIEKAEQLEKIGREIVAAIAVDADGELKKKAQNLIDAKNEAGSNEDGKTAAADDTGSDPPDEPESKEAAASGDTGTVADSDLLAKQAEVVAAIAATLQDGFNMADKTAAYLRNLAAAEKDAADADPTRPEGEDDSPSGKSDDSDESSDESSGDSGNGGGEPTGLPGSFGGEGSPPPIPGAGGEPPAPEAGGGPPPIPGAGEELGAGGGPSEDALLAALTGGENMGAEDALGGMIDGAPPEAGGAPPEAGGAPMGGPAGGMMAGAPPEAGGAPPMGAPPMGAPPMGDPAAGGAPPMGSPGMGAPGMGAPGMGEPGMGEPGMGAPGMGEPGMGEPGMGEPGMGEPGMGEPGMGGPSEEDLMLLMQALEAAGISPEEFEAAITAKAAQLAVKRHREKQGGKKDEWKPKTAQEAQRYQSMLDYVHEVVGR